MYVKRIDASLSSTITFSSPDNPYGNNKKIAVAIGNLRMKI